MVDKTLRECIVKVENILYQAAGTSTQVYSQTLISSKIQDAFDMLFSDRWWKRHMTRETGTLDGTTGAITGSFSRIKSYDDVYRIYPENSDIPLDKLSYENNQALNAQGGWPRQYEYNGTTGKLFTVYPIDATGTVTIVGRAYPATFNLNDTVPFDHLAICYKAAWDYAVDDGSNDAMTKKLENLYNQREKQLVSNQESDPVSLNGRRADYPTTWRDAE